VAASASSKDTAAHGVVPSTIRWSVAMPSSLVLASLWTTAAIAQRFGHHQPSGLYEHPNPSQFSPSDHEQSQSHHHWGLENFSGFDTDAENCLSELGTVQAGSLPPFKTDNVRSCPIYVLEQTRLTIYAASTSRLSLGSKEPVHQLLQRLCGENPA